MPDYNIYIRSIGGSGSGSSPTRAWSSSASQMPQTQAWVDSSGPSSALAQSFGDGGQMTPAMAMEMGKAMAAGGASGFGAFLVAVYEAAKTITYTELKIRSTIESFRVVETGDYTKAMNLENKKAAADAIFNPVGFFMNKVRNEQQIRASNQRQSLNRELLGDAIVNNNTRRV